MDDAKVKEIEERFNQIVTAEQAKSGTSRTTLIVVMVIILALAAGGGYYYMKNMKGKEGEGWFGKGKKKAQAASSSTKSPPKQVLAATSGDKLVINTSD